MQVPQSDVYTHAAPPLSLPQGNTDNRSTILLPLHGYQDKLSILLQALPIQALVIESMTLPAELIELIQSLCSHQDLLALTSVNKAAFAARFNNPRLQHLHFATAAQIGQFLFYCKQTQQTAKISAAIRTQEDFQQVNTLTLTLSHQFNTKQCLSLFPMLSGVTHLIIYPTTGQSLVSLNPLFKAAQYLALIHLMIGKQFERYEPIDEDSMPSALWQWRTLETLHLQNFSSIAYLAEDIGQLTQLTSLYLGAHFGTNTLLTALPESLGQLTQLKELVLDGLSTLCTLPEAVGQLKALKSLELSELKSLKALPMSLWQCDKLKHLTLHNLVNIAQIPEDIAQLHALKSLKLSCMWALKTLPANLWTRAKLEQLELFGLTRLKEISEQIGQLQALTSLELSNMDSLEALPVNLKQLSNLTRLVLDDVPIQEIPEEIGQLHALKSLELLLLRALKTLPTRLCQLDKLEKFTLWELNEIETLPEQLGQLKALKSLIVGKVEKITFLPTSLGQLQKLEWLSLIDLPSIHALPEEIDQLTALKTITLNNIPLLKTLPASLAQLNHLKEIDLTNNLEVNIPSTLEPYIKRRWQPIDDFTL